MENEVKKGIESASEAFFDKAKALLPEGKRAILVVVTDGTNDYFSYTGDIWLGFPAIVNMMNALLQNIENKEERKAFKLAVLRLFLSTDTAVVATKEK